MSARRSGVVLAASAVLIAAAGCATSAPVNYGPYLDHMPNSILVLPPTNQSVEVDAPYGCLSTVTRPLAERGYYVFPVALVDTYMKEQGLPTPAEMHAVPPSKLREVFGADAVLYLDVKDWGTRYVVISSQTSVVVDGRLVDLATGATLWTGSWVAATSSSQGQSNAMAMLVGALVHQIADTSRDAAHDLAAATSGAWIHDPKRGMLVGRRHLGFDEDQRTHRAARDAAGVSAGRP